MMKKLKKMKNNILNKCIRYLSFCSFFLLLYGCSNDDNGTIEVESEISTPSGTISFTINNSAVNKETILNLENGDFLEQMEVTGPVAIAEHREHTYLFRENSLVKQDGNGIRIWEKTYPEDELNPFEIFRSNTVFEEQAVFFSYSRLDTFTFERTHFLECVSLVDGGTIWIKNVSGETFPSLVNGRLLALTYPNGNSPVNFAYLDKENGSTTFEKTYEERIDPSNLTIDRNTILVSSWGDRVFALNTMLNEEWSFETGAENVRNGIIARNQLILPSRDRNVYALDKETGSPHLKFRIPKVSIPIMTFRMYFKKMKIKSSCLKLIMKMALYKLERNCSYQIQKIQSILPFSKIIWFWPTPPMMCVFPYALFICQVPKCSGKPIV